MVKVRTSRIDALVQERRFAAKYASRIVGNLNAYLSACQLGITLTSLGLGWVGEPAVAAMLKPLLSRFDMPETLMHVISFLVGFTIITAFHITIGEQYPKTYAIRKSEQITLIASIPMVVFYKMMYPLIVVLNGASNWLLRKSGIEPEGEHEDVHSEEEIKLLMHESHKSGLIDNTELTLVNNVFEFAETNAREIMIPRTEMVCFYAADPFEHLLEVATNGIHTRYPLCDPDKDNIIGYIHIKDLLKARKGLDDIRRIVRPLMSVPESMPISSLLRLMQKKRTEVALLIDEYGGTSGLVTVEDILEEIVGEIHDEFDKGRAPIEHAEDGSFSVDGLLHIDEVNDYFQLDIESEDHDTIGGWMYSQVEVPPRKNQRIMYRGFTFIIAEVDHLRISRITVIRTEPEESVDAAALQGAS